MGLSAIAFCSSQLFGGSSELGHPLGPKLNWLYDGCNMASSSLGNHRVGSDSRGHRRPPGQHPQGRRLGLMSSSWRAALTWLGAITMASPAVMAQTMGASSSSTGMITIPVTTVDVTRATYGSRNLLVINQSGGGAAGGLVVPTITVNLPELPRAIQPAQLFSKPKPFDPDLGPFEANR